MQTELRLAMKKFGLGMANLAIAIFLVIAVQAITRGRSSAFVPKIIGAAILAAAYLGGGRWIEGRQSVECARAGIVQEFAGGLGLGLGLFSAVMVLLWPIGIYDPVGCGTAAGLGVGAVTALLAAIIEEVLFRGFLFRLMEGVAGTWWALLVTSALFGAAHAFNPGATVLSSIAIAAEAGVLLGAAYATTRRFVVSDWAARGVEFLREQGVWDERIRFRSRQRFDYRNRERASNPNRRTVRPGSLDCRGAGVLLSGIVHSVSHCSARAGATPELESKYGG